MIWKMSNIFLFQCLDASACCQQQGGAFGRNIFMYSLTKSISSFTMEEINGSVLLTHLNQSLMLNRQEAIILFISRLLRENCIVLPSVIFFPSSGNEANENHSPYFNFSSLDEPAILPGACSSLKKKNSTKKTLRSFESYINNCN